MDATFDAFLRSWPLDPWTLVPLLLTAGLYLRGWRQLRRRGAERFGPPQLLTFLGGLGTLFLALASPIEPFASLLLLVHMIQHLLLMLVAPPLLWLGEPLLPLLCGLPAPVRQVWVGPFLQLRWVRAALRQLTQPVAAWLPFVVATWFWHLPRFYELALQVDGWHYVEHACFLMTGLLFWWPVVQPFPARLRWSSWLLLPYLFLADVQNTALAALLTFSDRVLYPHYAAMPRLGGLSALEDQSAAGVLMWVPGSVVFLLPLVVIGTRLLHGLRLAATRQGSATSALPCRVAAKRISLPMVPGDAPAWDILHLPLLGRFLRWRHARLAMQTPLFLAAITVITDGVYGPQIEGLNLAGVLPWIHWRGLVVLGLLIGGNFFCAACPFLLPRRIAKAMLPADLPWPRWLRTKWLALLLLVLFFWAYETFALWASPWWTAGIAVGYFLTAFTIDGFFRGAAFCKYVCPIGQFNFVQSLASPLEVAVRAAKVCRKCETKDCIRGRAGIPGCELHLFLPRKAGNFDCTFCLDCVHACPHDNIGLIVQPPGAALWHDRQRSGIGRFSRRLDVAALVVVLVFAAFINAAMMVAPVVAWQKHTIALLLLLPLLLVGSAAALGRWWSNDPGRWREVAAHFAFALLPLGFGMWLAHYSFHFFTSAGSIVPVIRRCLADMVKSLPSMFVANADCCSTAEWLLRLEILFLDLGLLLSLYTAYRIALERRPRIALALRALVPWAVLILILFAVGIWIVFQPMEMRGTLPPG